MQVVTAQLSQEKQCVVYRLQAAVAADSQRQVKHAAAKHFAAGRGTRDKNCRTCHRPHSSHTDKGPVSREKGLMLAGEPQAHPLDGKPGVRVTCQGKEHEAHHKHTPS